MAKAQQRAISRIDTRVRKSEQDIRALRNDELDAVSGAGLSLSAAAEAVKNLGNAL